MRGPERRTTIEHEAALEPLFNNEWAGRDLAKATRGARWLGFLVGAGAIAAFVLWGGFVPLAGGVVAEGVLRAEGGTRVVQHLEGGVVAMVQVREGERVAAGQPLLTLAKVDAVADRDRLRLALIDLEAREARLVAEEAGRENLEFPAALREEADAAPFVSIQSALFAARKAALHAQVSALEERGRQLTDTLRALEARLVSVEGQLDVMREEAADKEKLLARGLARKPEVLSLRRSLIELEGRAAELLAQRSIGAGERAEVEMRLAALRSERQSEINKELADVRTSLAGAREQHRARADVVARAVVTAPIEGHVVNLRVMTPGSVVRPGDVLLEIVPRGEELLVEARVAINDVDNVQPGLAVVVSLPGYPATTPRLSGTVRHVSADRIEDAQARTAYYVAEVALAADENRAGVELRSGMAAQVLIVTGERTMARYLFDPFIRALERGMRES